MAPPRHPSRRIPVCILDENQLAILHMRNLLEAGRELNVVDVRGFFRLAPMSRTRAVLVVDRFGLKIPLSRCIRHFEECAPGARFLILDRDLRKDEVQRLLSLGAYGYLDHGEVTRQLLPAVRHIAAGGLWVAPEVLQNFLREAAGALSKRSRNPEELTEREQQVLELVRQRLSNHEIAALLKIRISTVKFHLSNVLSKLHQRRRRDLYESHLLNSWERFPQVG